LNLAGRRPQDGAHVPNQRNARREHPMIDFTLTSEQKALQQVAREFAQDVLKPIVREADAEPDPQKGFQMIKPAYEKAYELGFAMCFLPKEYGGGGVSNVDLLIAAEE